MKIIIKMKEKICLAAIVILSVLFNFINIGIEGYSNQYYAAGVKSMTMNLKNFFFVALDPAGFVTIDKPPFGFWMQAISAKIFGFSGWSILLPQALAGVLSVVLIYVIVKKSFGSAAGLISALCLSITPVLVAVSRNNTIDMQLVFVLLLACWALLAAAEKGKFKYLVLSMVFIGIGFNIKMLQAYMILPAVYVMYLLSSKISIIRRSVYIVAATAILLAVSFSWAIVADSIPAKDRPYIGSSSNNTVMGLITGHNGTERLSLGNLFSNSGQNGNPGRNGPGGQFPGNQGPWGNDGGFAPGGPPPGGQDMGGQDGVGQDSSRQNGGGQNSSRQNSSGQDGTGQNSSEQNSGRLDGGHRDGGFRNGSFGDGLGGGPSGGPGGPGGTGLSGTFGNQTPAGITRLFSKNILSDQIVWFIPLALIGFIASAIREKLRFKLDTPKKQALVLWFMWLLPEFIYFSFNTGLFHPHYLIMMAPPIAALSGIGIVSMWKMYNEGGWKSWFLPLALLANGSVQMLMLSYFYSSSYIVKVLMGLLAILCFVSAFALIAVKFFKSVLPQIKTALVCLAFVGICVAPAAGSAGAMFYAVDSTIPSAGLELLPKTAGSQNHANFQDGRRGFNREGGFQNFNTADLVKFLNNNKVNGKSQIVVASADTAENLTLNTDLYVGSLSGFQGNEKVMSLEQFKERVKQGKIRYVLANDNNGRGGFGNEILSWVEQNGKLVSYAQSDSSASSDQNTTEQVYDLIGSVKD
ncbi:MAG: glycosyltransferase family 39 protein [Bacillota bacterium]|nr:glycosyltransferase family 39 protein [Bacillota bacterium]